VTGLSGAGKSTVLNTLEDLGWEVVENLPLSLLSHLLATPPPAGSADDRPLAIGLDSRTRGFDARKIVGQVKALAKDRNHPVETLYLDCAGAELIRRYSETRRRHPLATDRPATDGIAEERELMAPLRRWAITSSIPPTPTPMRCASRSAPGSAPARCADAERPVVRLRPRAAAKCRPGLRHAVPEEPALADRPAAADRPRRSGRRLCRRRRGYDGAVSQMEELILTLLPVQGRRKSYVTVAFGCTGGRHRSVHVAHRVAARLRAADFRPRSNIVTWPCLRATTWKAEPDGRWGRRGNELARVGR
jgi:UPF0042 nucleotide-binding protein